MESALVPFSQPGAFGSFVGTKEQGGCLNTTAYINSKVINSHLTGS
jgi:hypothetical protein